MSSRWQYPPPVSSVAKARQRRNLTGRPLLGFMGSVAYTIVGSTEVWDSRRHREGRRRMGGMARGLHPGRGTARRYPPPGDRFGGQ
jgi:hypothetical protein